MINCRWSVRHCCKVDAYGCSRKSNPPQDRSVVTRAVSRIREKLDIDLGTARELQRSGVRMMEPDRCGVRDEVLACILNLSPFGPACSPEA